MMWSERLQNEIYVFWNGQLVYKRWISGDGNKKQPSLLSNKVWPSVWIVDEH